ncbi:MAG: VOC family protein [Dermatophilaceae bacterium]
MSMRWYSVVVDCHDLAAQARWWAETLDYALVFDSDTEAAIVPRWSRLEPMEDLETFRHEPQGNEFCVLSARTL